jgi:hypothetical protein
MANDVQEKLREQLYEWFDEADITTLLGRVDKLELLLRRVAVNARHLWAEDFTMAILAALEQDDANPKG